MPKTTTTTTIRVLIADKCLLTQIGMSTIVANEERFMLIGEATESDETLALSRELKPDVLVLNLNTIMPNADVSEKSNYLIRLCSEVKVLLISLLDNFHIHSLLTSGVAGYVLIDEEKETLINAIHTVAHGHTWYNQSILEKMTHGRTENPFSNKRFDLTKREQQVLSLIAEGHSNFQIATNLCIAEQTVRNYVSNIYKKLELNSRVEAIIWTRDNDWALSRKR